MNFTILDTRVERGGGGVGEERAGDDGSSEALFVSKPMGKCCTAL